MSNACRRVSSGGSDAGGSSGRSRRSSQFPTNLTGVCNDQMGNRVCNHLDHRGIVRLHGHSRRQRSRREDPVLHCAGDLRGAAGNRPLRRKAGLALVHEARPAPRTEARLRNPWARKNPFLSMWLSGANAVLGSTRARATAEARRQASMAAAEGFRQMMHLWTGMAPPAPKRRRRRTNAR